MGSEEALAESLGGRKYREDQLHGVMWPHAVASLGDVLLSWDYPTKCWFVSPLVKLTVYMLKWYQMIPWYVVYPNN